VNDILCTTFIKMLLLTATLTVKKPKELKYLSSLKAGYSHVKTITTQMVQ
jgi:hypothetical protein